MLVGVVAKALGYIALFGENGGFRNVGAEAGQFERIAVQFLEAPGYQLAFGVIPGAEPDAVAGVDDSPRVVTLGAQISMEGFGAADGGGARLADGVGAGNTTEVGAFTGAGARNEKAHGLGWGRRLLCERQGGTDSAEHDRPKNVLALVHF